jgi:hypothetical protein
MDGISPRLKVESKTHAPSVAQGRGADHRAFVRSNLPVLHQVGRAGLLRKRDLVLMLVLGGLTAALTAAAGQLLGQPIMVSAGATCFELQTGSADGVSVTLHITNLGGGPVRVVVEAFGETRTIPPNFMLRRVVAPQSTLDLSVASSRDGAALIIASEPLLVNAAVIGTGGSTTPRSTLPCRAAS